MDELLRFLLTESPVPEPLGSVEDWWTRHLRLSSRFSLPVDVAFAGGFAADRLGYAFASGYHSALRSLFPSLAREHRYALCVTEAEGGHPAAMNTRLTGSGEGSLRLEGSKAFVTLGTAADELLVVASEGEDAQGRKRLRLVRIDSHRPGVTLTELPPTPFVPEVPHAELHLHEVTVASGEVLPGDGYERYVKPFRTVEDCHVFAAVLGWLFQVARRSGWPDEVREELLALAVTMRGLAQMDPASPAVHLALAGAIDLCRRRVDGLEPLWAQVDAPTRERWERDRMLLNVAGKVRAKRREVARQKLAAPS
ncbi:acyl-CoA dehydrogenase family protein [Vitiosangium sp. GDMCC 1.1324]|uniref:acyl-CoA dehydrogenase family protein n=1 Tax=Vitiosangium sp. (strain GDMCC 1.1324) TaxID=2138576 RepID=UPI000D33F6EB|nr:acyl-CoA dehydrogenase family protein [Vitiosangium sp. GDMCC 1.1324]PTL78731.1 acyl-CoA dehydrogenase [Vitiosangium sp. GDMCC 1.1324]